MSEDIKFTGEFFIPGKSGERIEADHIERYKFASRYVAGKTVLDIACGTGYASPMLIEAGAVKYEGVDRNQELVEYTIHKYGSESISFCVGDICTFNPRKTYDVVTCFETIEHVENYQSAISNLNHLLKPGGTLMISSPNRPITSPGAIALSDKPSNRFHTQEFTPTELLNELHTHGFITDKANIYGQRQQRLWPNRFIRKIAHIIYGNPDFKSSPEVMPIKNKTPRYFIIVAKKSDKNI